MSKRRVFCFRTKDFKTAKDLIYAADRSTKEDKMFVLPDLSKTAKNELRKEKFFII